MTEPEVHETPAESVEEPKPDREAAKWRRQVRERDALLQERDARIAELEGREQTRLRSDLERIATTGDGPRLHDVSDIWGDDVDFSELVDDLGRVDPDAVRGVIEAYTEGRQYLRADRPDRRGDPSQGHGRDFDHGNPASWAAVLRTDN